MTQLDFELALEAQRRLDCAKSDILELEEDENLPVPSNDAIAVFHAVRKRLGEQGMNPSRVMRHVYGGVHLVYKHGDRQMIVETYNDGDIAVVVSDIVTQMILYSADTSDMVWLDDAVMVAKRDGLGQ